MILFVGEDNPYNPHTDAYDLYPDPRHSAGGRLCYVICGLRMLTYLQQTRRVNLVRGSWENQSARDGAQRQLNPSLPLGETDIHEVVGK